MQWATLIPTLLRWRDSAVVVDIHGETYEATHKWRREIAGNRIIRFAPLADVPTDGIADTYNPLDAIRVGSHHAIGDAHHLASLLVEERMHRTDATWADSVRALLCAYILDAASTGGTFTDVAVAIHAQPDTPARIATQALDALAPFLAPEIAKSCARSSFGLSDVMDGDRPATLYLSVMAHSLEQVRPVWRVLLEQLARRSAETREHRHKLLLMFDALA